MIVSLDDSEKLIILVGGSVTLVKIQVPSDFSQRSCEESKVRITYDIYNTELIKGVDGEVASAEQIERFWEWLREQKQSH